MPIDPCQCPSTIEGLLKAIYCTLVDISENGAVVNLENITGISAFWKATLGGTPAANQVFGTDGTGVFTTLDYADTGVALLALELPLNDSFITMGTGGTAGFAEFGVTDATAAAPFNVLNGVVIAVT